jgi:hypothetical protein
MTNRTIHRRSQSKSGTSWIPPQLLSHKKRANNGQLSIVYRLKNLKLNYELKNFLHECLQGSLIGRYTSVAKAEIVRCGAELEKEQY